MALPFGLAACTEPNDEGSLLNIWSQADAVCASGRERIPAAELFVREERLCYAYETVQDRPLPILFPHYTDNDHLRGEARGYRTFDIATTSIRSTHGSVIHFYDEQYQCYPIENLVAVRDVRTQAQLGASCVLLVGTPEQIERYTNPAD